MSFSFAFRDRSTLRVTSYAVCEFGAERLYSMAVLLRNGSYFHRMHEAVRLHVHERLLSRGPNATQVHVLSYTTEVMHFVLRQCGAVAHENTDNVHIIHGMARKAALSEHDRKILSLSPDDLIDTDKCNALLADPGRKTSCKIVLQAIMQFMRLSNGPLWERYIKHTCSGDNSCLACGGNAAKAVSELANCIRQLLLRTLPVVPVANNWTTISPCVHFSVSGILVHGILPCLFHAAFQQFTGAARAKPASGDDDDLDPAMREEVDFHAVNGGRIERTQQFFDCQEQHSKLIIFALVLEPLQWITSVLLANSQEVLDFSRPPLICDCLLQQHSPFVVALQYLSALLHGRGGRVAFLYRSVGYDSFEQWAERRPAMLQLFRSAVMAVSAWIWRRHHHELHQHPWRLMALADTRLKLNGCAIINPSRCVAIERSQ